MKKIEVENLSNNSYECFKLYDFHTVLSVTMHCKTKATVCYLAQTKSNCISNGLPMMIIRGYNKKISVVVIHIKIKY